MFLLRNNIILSLKVKLLQRKKSFFFLKELKKRFPQAKIYLVGGAVRDLLLSRSTQDYDLVVCNVPLDILKSFLSKIGNVNLVGQTFGVLKFVPNEVRSHQIRYTFDIALPRKDFSFKTGGYRDVRTQNDPQLSIEDDLSRRDFTINAMAIELNSDLLKKNVLIDPKGGYRDLKQRIIKTVGNPEERFKEDYSRILRGIRFACQLNNNLSKVKWEIEKETWQAMKDKMPRLITLEEQVIPYEVIAKEFIKSFVSSPVRAFDLYDQSGGFKELIPEVLKMKNCPQPENYHTEGDVWKHTRLALEQLNSPYLEKKCGHGIVSKEVIIATLFHDLGKPYTIQTPEKDGTNRIRFNDHDVIGSEKAKEIAQRLKLSSPDKVGINIDEMVWLVKQHMVLIKGDITKMRPKTIEKYFFNPHYSGQKLLQISFVDISATITKEGPLSFDRFDQMLERINGLKELSENKKELPKPLVNGNDLIKKFNLFPGPRIGELLDLVREEQLNGRLNSKKQALEFLESIYDESE